MRTSYVVCFLVAVFSLPGAAADADQNLKQEVERIGSAYAESFNRKDGAGIAALYASSGMLVNAAGLHADIAQAYEILFKAGFNHQDITVNQVWPLGADTALSMGEYQITGKNQSGAPIEIAGLWTAVDVREGGKWKIRLLTAIPKTPQAPK
jgi:ketosteroid isomerase-like protein